MKRYRELQAVFCEKNNVIILPHSQTACRWLRVKKPEQLQKLTLEVVQTVYSDTIQLNKNSNTIKDTLLFGLELFRIQRWQVNDSLLAQDRAIKLRC